MKYMICWSIQPENYTVVMDNFLKSGAPMPKGLTLLGRYHAPGSSKGWALCETENPLYLAQHIAEWSPLVKFDITPVLEDAEAAEAIARARN
ncbi:DUF3303 domain-containing protein [Sulfurovum sp. ST-21]|uniref:DUF3303 family protein n=1 Tax=Sulfurovum indicum TaxID=2779528 RepID=A0A7M1S7W7_9BACT|nr:DUF3303 family protein [Sulfurovum indicum]QOR62809.1 DUF3303 family protein [Sulfurovum indicum]